MNMNSARIEARSCENIRYAKMLFLLVTCDYYLLKIFMISEDLPQSAGRPAYSSRSTEASSAVFRLVLITLSPAHNPIHGVISGKCTDSWLAAVIEPAIPSNILMYPPRFVPFHYDKERIICLGLQLHILFC